MAISRSTFYDAPVAQLEEARIIAQLRTICDEFESYGYRRVAAALRHRGVIVNHKKIRRLMREYDLQPKRRRRYVVTTDSNHDGLIFPDRARGLIVEGSEPALGCRHHIHRDRDGLRLSGGDPGRLVAQGGRLCDQSLDRRQTGCRRAQSRHPGAPTA